MKTKILRLFYLLLTLNFVTLFCFAQPCREVVGYYAGWKWYKRNKLVNPESIDYSKYSILNYAFFKPLADGTVVEGDVWADNTILLGKEIKVNGILQNESTSSLVYNAHLHNVKVIGSVGGWTWSSAFPGISADSQKRFQFAASCIALVKKYNLDGIDIDWEYPGNKAHCGTPADKQNFTLLLQTLKNALTDYSSSCGKQMLLTAAFGPAPSHMDQIDWDKVTPLLDMVNLMTYNYYGAWDKITNHNCPLFKPSRGNVAYNIDASLKTLTEVYKVPASKINLGLAFYGRSVTMQDAPALFANSTGQPDGFTFPEEKGTPSYYNIVSRINLYDKQWDEKAKVPYLTGKNGLPSFISYDDPESISLKSTYALENNLNGVVIWDISGDYIETYPGSGVIAETPLCNAINNVFCKWNQASGLSKNQSVVGLTAFPNPFKSEIEIKWNSDFIATELKVMNGSGQVVFQTNSDLDGKLELNTSQWASGIYFINLFSPGKADLVKVLKL